MVCQSQLRQPFFLGFGMECSLSSNGQNNAITLEGISPFKLLLEKENQNIFHSFFQMFSMFPDILKYS